MEPLVSCLGFINKTAEFTSACSCFSFRVEFESFLLGRRDPTVDGSEILHQLIWDFPIVCRVAYCLCMLGGDRRISEPSTVSAAFGGLWKLYGNRNPKYVNQHGSDGEIGVLLLMEEIRLTTWDVKNPANNGINYLSTGAGFLPSTGWRFNISLKRDHGN